MSADWNYVKWLGPFATPLVIMFFLLGLFVSFQSYADTLGWRIVSIVVFLVSLVWCIWYRASKVTKEPVVLAGVEPRKVWRHENKSLRRLALFLPALTGVLCVLAFVHANEPDYSELLQGGSFDRPMVVFDSEPRGAEVRIAWAQYAEEDPWLESKDEGIWHLPERTLTRLRLAEGHYMAVFELEGRRIQKPFIVTAPTVVKVEF